MGLATLLTVSVVWFVIYNANQKTIGMYNSQIESTAKMSISYLSTNYGLYSGTLKYSEIVDDFLLQNPQISKFEIINTDGKVVYDSLAKGAPNNPVFADSEVLELSKKETLSILPSGQRINKIVEPYFTEWGSHSYTLIYYPSYIMANQEINVFNLEMILIGTLILFSLFTLVGIFVLKERARIEEEEKNHLQQIGKQQQGFMVLAAHNLRTPLTNMIGFSSLLAETELTNEQKKLIEPVLDNSRKLEDLVENILAITDVLGDPNAPVYKERVEVSTIINESIQKLTDRIKRKRISLKLDIQKNLPILVNQKYARLAVGAIIDNAIKFNKVGGSIKIKAVRSKDKAVISITDTGKGIAAGETDKVFNIFHKAISDNILMENFEGTGIGLYMAKMISEFMGGSLNYTSKVGGGTTFNLEFVSPKETIALKKIAEKAYNFDNENKAANSR